MTLELARDERSGAYKRAEKCSPNEPERYFTAFVRFNWGDGSAGNSAVEEIDVIGRDDSDARVIASVALAQDYDPGGRIIQVTERERGVIFHDV